MLSARSMIRFITLPFCSSCMDDDHPGHDIHVSAPGYNLPVYLSGFPVSGTCIRFRIRTLGFSFRIAFTVRIKWVTSDRKLIQQLY